jgi:hypothetical protein
MLDDERECGLRKPVLRSAEERAAIVTETQVPG